MQRRLKPGVFPIVIIVLQLSLLFTFFFDVPVARQVIGFLFLTLLPGYAIVRLLKLKLERVETVLFSVGSSLAFLMISTFFVNLVFPVIGITKPLAPIPMLIIANSMLVVLVIMEWRSSANIELPIEPSKLALFGIILLLPLVLTIIGVYLVRIPPHVNNTILLIMFITISALVGLASLQRKFFPKAVLPILLFVVSVALLLHTSLFSSNLQGGDIFGENFVFRSTLANLYWDPAIMGRLSAMLSITLLPTAYSLILNMDSTWVLKIVFPMIFAFVPLALYQMYKTRLSTEICFFSAFFFVSNLVFFNELAQLARQMIGELFYVLLFLTLFSKSVKGSRKWLLFFAFSFGLVVSHYAMAYIFLAFIVATWFISRLRKGGTKITMSLVVLLGILVFAWYIYTSQASNFNDLLGTVNYVGKGFASDFFNAQSRGGQVLQAVGVSGISTYWHVIGRYVYYATEGLIIVGLALMLLKERISFFNDDYNVLVFLNLILLGACIIVPNFSGTFNASRFYHVTLFFLAPLCVLGGVKLMKLISRNKINEKILSMILVLCLLIPFFFFQTGFVYEVTKEASYSLPLSSYRIDPLTQANLGLLTDAEVHAGDWISENAGFYRNISADASSLNILVYTNVKIRSDVFPATPIPSSSYIFLREYNVADGIVFSDLSQYGSFNLTQIVPPLNDTNLTYSNGLNQVYSVP
jgi:uncharacterized membrane protein